MRYPHVFGRLEGADDVTVTDWELAGDAWADFALPPPACDDDEEEDE